MYTSSKKTFLIFLLGLLAIFLYTCKEAPPVSETEENGLNKISSPSIVLVANIPGRTYVEIRNVGAGPFNPAKLTNWHYDYRNPIIPAKTTGPLRNIYNPSIVYNGAWNIYFGGWDGITDSSDQISMVVSSDNFLTFSSHFLKIDNGVFLNVNNVSAIKVSPSHWRMIYTTGYSNELNKPAFATATDGMNWSPFSPDEGYRLGMTGYSFWSSANVNGLNAIYYAGSRYHLYFGDLNHQYGTFHATSADGRNFKFDKNTVPNQLGFTDIKALMFAGDTSYIMVKSDWGTHTIYRTISTDLNGTFPTPGPLFVQQEPKGDSIMNTVGLVSDGTTLYGALYGQSPYNPPNAPDHHVIKAAWLQKEVRFIFPPGGQYGANELALGPNTIRMEMPLSSKNGYFIVLDTDGVTPLYDGQQIGDLKTIHAGDIWEYRP
jgi:hypothetical protein